MIMIVIMIMIIGFVIMIMIEIMFMITIIGYDWRHEKMSGSIKITNYRCTKCVFEKSC